MAYREGTGAAAGFGGTLYDIAIDAADNLYVSDTQNYTIRKITPNGVVSTLAGSPGMAGAADGNGTAARFYGPAALAIDGAGNLYVGDGPTIRKISPTGTVTTFAGRHGQQGDTDGTGTAARFRSVISLAFAPNGDLYAGDTGNCGLRKITPAGVVSTINRYFTANGAYCDTEDGSGAELGVSPELALAIDRLGNFYVLGGEGVQKINPSGVATTFVRASNAAMQINDVIDGRTCMTHLMAAPSPTAAGQSVTLTASVSGNAPAGTVTFKDGGVSLGTVPLTAGTAILATAGLSAGHRHLVAEYSGDGANPASRSGTVHLTVGPTSTTLMAGPNPVVQGQSTQVTATVSGANPSGEIEFFLAVSGQVPFLNTVVPIDNHGQAVLVVDTSSLATGSYSVDAWFKGDARNSESYAKTLSLSVVNGPVATATALTASPNPATAGQAVTLTATVTGSNPTGTVTFKDGTTILGTGTLSGATATYTTTALAAGSHSLSASYGGNAANKTSNSATVALTVRAVTTTTLTASPNPVMVGQTLTLTAKVTGSSPTGTVTFKDGATALGSKTLSSGAATLTTTALAAGNHVLTVEYAGYGNNLPSLSPAVAVEVKAKAVSATTLTANPNPSLINQAVTLTATVTGNNPTGTIAFKAGATLLGNKTLSAGVATLTTTGLGAGAYNLTASYAGDVNNQASVSATINQTVKANTGTTLTVSPNPATAGQMVTLTATVTGSGPTGTVTFKDGSVVLGSGTLSGGKATYGTAGLAKGTHSLTARYEGDTGNNVSASTAVNLTVK